MKKIYLAGDLLTKGSIMQREWEKRKLEEAGLRVHSPVEDEEINDKRNQTEESNNGLAERIVRKDTKAMLESDVVVIEPQPFALGTHVELGQLKGMKDMAKMVGAILAEENLSEGERLKGIAELVKLMIKKPVYAHFGDIRRTEIPERGDRRSWGVNQYVYGAVLDLTDGVGFRDFEEIVEEVAGLRETSTEVSGLCPIRE